MDNIKIPKSEARNPKIKEILEIGKRHWVNLFLAIILLASFFLMIFSARSDSLTVDEKIHIMSGYLHVWEGDYTFNSEHPPLLNNLAGLSAKLAKVNLPDVSLADFQASDQWTYGDLFFYQSENNVDKIIFWARLPFIFLTLGLVYLSFLWAKTVFGPKAGLVAAALVGFCPNILAHGRLATTDMGLGLAILLSVWLLRKYILKSDQLNAFYLGLAVSFVILSKFSGLIILPIILIGLIYTWIVKRPKITLILSHLTTVFLLIFVICWLVYIFSMRAQLDQGLLKAPLDKLIQGYYILADHNQAGHWNYLNGQINFQGWWYYFPLVLWYKLTIVSIILFALAIITWPYTKKKFLEEFLIIFPPLLFLGLSMTSRIDIGIRHILPVLPFIFIFISRLFNSKNFILKPIVTGMVILHLGLGIFAFPNYISYFNQIAGGPQNGINHLVDSNLDWNQNIKRFAHYTQENNLGKIYEYCWDQEAFNYYGIEADFLPSIPVKGVVVVCAHQLIFYETYGHDISWVTKSQPDDIVAHTMYVWRFDLPANR